MIKRGIFCAYQGKTYYVSNKDKDNVRLVSYDRQDLDRGFQPKIYPENYRDRDKLPDIFIKTVNICQVDSLYEIIPSILYKGIKYSVKGESDEFYYIGTDNIELAEKYGFDRTDKYFYEKTVLKSECELIEEVKNINS